MLLERTGPSRCSIITGIRPDLRFPRPTPDPTPCVRAHQNGPGLGNLPTCFQLPECWSNCLVHQSAQDRCMTYRLVNVLNNAGVTCSP